MIPDTNFFFFKGKRDYVHSGEIFNSIISRLDLPVINDVDFSISKKLRSQWDFFKDKPEEAATMVGQLKVADATYFIIENGRPVTERKDYNEKEVLQNCKLNKHCITHPNVISKYSFLENVVASYKHLLNSSIYTDASHTYVFMRLVIRFIPFSQFTVQHKRRFAKKFFEAAIVVKNNPVGKMYFLEE